VTEGPSDWQRIRVLIEDRLQRRREPAEISQVMRFEPFQGAPYVSIRDIPKLVRELGLDRRYTSEGPNKGDGGTLRKLFQILRAKRLLGPDLVVIWGRDDDGDPERRKDAVRARSHLPDDNHVLLAIASECGEAWIIAGWRPATSDETAILRTLRQELGFDPCVAPERLSHKKDAPKSAKRVVMSLCANDPARERISLVDACYVPAAGPCGLRAFCDDLDAWLSTVGA
jgi:hypothetical protein